jgi:hypothetical protein
VSVPPKSIGTRWPRVWGALAVGLAAFAAYALAATPAAYPLDSAELAAASFGLGVAHPPGEETTLLLGKLFTLLPMGGVAFKVALSQAVAGALAAVLVFLLVLDLAERLPAVTENTGEPVRVLLAGAAALAFAYAPGVVIVSDRPEVYATQTALSLAALWLAMRAQDDPRRALLAALLIGFGIANHSLVAGLTGVGAVAAALPLLRSQSRVLPRGRFVALSVAAFAVGMLVHAYLPLRSAALLRAPDAMDGVLWGDARSWRGFWWVVSARTFAEKAGVVHSNASPGDLPFLLIEELGLVFAVVAPAGAYFLLRQSRSRVPGAAVLFAVAGSLAAAAAGGVDPGNPDIRGYLGPAIACVAVLSGVAVTVGLAVFRWGNLRSPLAAVLLMSAATRFPSPTQYPGLGEARAAEATVRETLGELPPRSALFTNHFETGFLVGYLRLVEGARPDVAWAHLASAKGPGYSDRVRDHAPELGAAIEAKGYQDFLAALSRLDPARPVRIEPDVVLGSSVRRGLGPAGDLWSVASSTSQEAPPTLPGWMLLEASRDRQVRGYLAWRNFVDARWSCELGLSERGHARIAELEKLVPNDDSLRELRKRCP